ncbi:MAG TPA: LTA synthase family protein, partial [Myxococcota bacterium]
MSSSARADSFVAARTAAAACAWGFVVAKLAAVLSGLLAGAGLITLPAFVSGFAGDVIVLAVVFACAFVLARFARAARIALVAAVLLGAYACANVYLVAAFGSPLTAQMLAYRKDAAEASLAHGPLAFGLGALAVFALGAWPAVRLARRMGARAVAASLGLCAVLLVIGLALPLFDEDGGLRALGLDRNAVAVLVTTALPERETAQARIPWDAPWPAPRDAAARWLAPVDVDTSHGRPKHIVLWLAESTGARHTSLYGGPKNATPTLEKLRPHSLRFLHYDANTPVSAKAIFASLCGFYPAPEAAFETRTNPRIACPSLMETLTSAGYSAALFHGGYFAFTDKMELLGERGFDLMLDGESVPDRDRYFENGWGIDDQAIVDHGLSWLDAHKDRPTLSVYIPLLPHYEYFMPPKAPKPFGDGSLLARYENGVHYSDQMFGELVDAYRERGLLDDTLFVFVGDHGEAFEEHPLNKLHAGFLYEENVQSPLVLYSTKLFPREQTSERLGSHVDLAATLLDLVGVPVPASTQGQSLVSPSYVYRP